MRGGVVEAVEVPFGTEIDGSGVLRRRVVASRVGHCGWCRLLAGVVCPVRRVPRVSLGVDGTCAALCRAML